jgi:hypothetical protein
MLFGLHVKRQTACATGKAQNQSLFRFFASANMMWANTSAGFA